MKTTTTSSDEILSNQEIDLQFSKLTNDSMPHATLRQRRAYVESATGDDELQACIDEFRSWEINDPEAFADLVFLNLTPAQLEAKLPADYQRKQLID